MKDRITRIIKDKNYTAAQFADEIGVQKSGISHILSGRNNPSLDFIQKILFRFPEVNTEWLMFGKGEPYKSIQDSTYYADNKEETSENDTFQAPVDLFSGQLVENNVKYATEESLKNENAQIPVHEIQPQELQKLKIPKNRNVDKETEKKIVKVILFYNDKTCTEYNME